MKGDNFRIGTFMCPSIPVEFYELLASYFEEKLGVCSSLIYDSKREGPIDIRNDKNKIDIAFVSTYYYLQCLGGSGFHLLPVGAVTSHPSKGETLGYYTDIVLHRDAVGRCKEFLDLRGSQFVFSRDTSLSAGRLVLQRLRQLGENASFFASTHASGSHVMSLESLIGKKAEAAAVDSITLSNYLSLHYYHKDEIHLHCSLGPLPPHPIIVNESLPASVKSSIREALLSMHNSPKWRKQLEDFSVLHFQKVSEDTYLNAKDLLMNTDSLSLAVMYY